MKLQKAVLVFTSLIFLVGVSSQLTAATEVVNNFGQNGWYSWDTRSSAGTQLVGTNDTSPAWPGYAGSNSAANDTAIQQQIIFMGEGQSINDEAGRTRNVSPTGSLGGLGYVRLDGTSANGGKSDLSYISTTGIAPATALTAGSFGLSYRYYIDADPSIGSGNTRTLGLNISLTNSTQSNLYTFAYVNDANNPPAAGPGWNISSVSASSGLFSLFANGSSAESGATKTLTDWMNDPTFGSAIFGGTEEIFRIGFNLGSGQHNGLNYLDWMDTNLLNNGDTIDFQAVPEPTTWLAASLAGLMLIVQIVRARAFSRRTTETLKS